MPLKSPIVFEQGDKYYFVGPVAPSKPSAQDIEEYAFGRDIIGGLRDKAPNEHIAWFAGHYVEADQPNLNGAMWRGSEIAVKALTPMFMPVTVMHDPRTAVGLIADLALKVPDRDGVQRSKIDTALALWRHRFPEVVEEAEHNYAQGMLMQSMECLAPDYECSDCGAHYHKLPDGAERENWCAHLKNGDAARTLRSVVFTGTGLIFGSRGAQGADPSAYLESFTQEVAEFHSRAHADSRPKRSKPKMDEITLAKSEYDRLIADRDAAAARAEKAESERDDAIREQEKAEAEKVKAEEQATALQSKVTNFEEKARQDDLAGERFETLGKGFIAKLGDKTRERLRQQAGAMSDEDWTARLDEIEDLTGAKRDDKGEDEDGADETANRKGARRDGEFTEDEIARSRTGRTSTRRSPDQTPASRRSVVGSLIGSGKKS